MKAIYEHRLPFRFNMYSNNFHLCRLQSMAAINEMNRMCVLINRIDDCDKREKSTTHVYNGRHIFTIEWKRHLNLNWTKHLFIVVVIMSRILHTSFFLLLHCDLINTEVLIGTCFWLLDRCVFAASINLSQIRSRTVPFHIDGGECVQIKLINDQNSRSCFSHSRSSTLRVSIEFWTIDVIVCVS